MATNMYCAKALIGGAAGALDLIAYADLADQDMALTIILTGAAAVLYVHAFDASSALDESSPDVVAPDDVAANNGRWILAGTTLAAVAATTLTASTDPVDANGVGDRAFNDARYALEANNLDDLANAATARTNLGLGTIATQASDAVNIDGGTIDDVDHVKAGGVGPGVDGLVQLTSSDGVKIMEMEALAAGASCHFGTVTDHDFYITRNDAVMWRFDDAQFSPQVDDSYDIGDMTHRLDNIYATNGTIQTSDVVRKEGIAETPLGLDFIKALSPKQFKWKDIDIPDQMDVHKKYVAIPAHKKTHIRKHHGLIAQDVEQVLADKGIDTNDFAGFIKDSKTGNQGLRYGEFMAPLIKAIQELSTKNEALETRIAALEK